MSERTLKAKLSLAPSPVYKDSLGKWRLAEQWVITGMEKKRADD